MERTVRTIDVLTYFYTSKNKDFAEDLMELFGPRGLLPGDFCAYYGKHDDRYNYVIEEVLCNWSAEQWRENVYGYRYYDDEDEGD